MATAKITLTPREIQLRQLLLDVACYIDESKQIKEKIELRWAGGWVRDKLLNAQSHDIDTAINAMTGFDFTTKMQEFLENKENMEKHNLHDGDLGTLYKIMANPEKSKNLETATTRIFGFDVDFVNLRTETYSGDGGRIPQMEFGTAQEDALRRDATINALFYNLHTDSVEDFTGGLQDLDAKLIRTPMAPRTTFLDDPLRVLRLIRFATRLSFTIDPESLKQMGDASIKEAFMLKISRERVGVEVEKMLKGKNPRGSLVLFDQLGLYSTVFTDPTHPDLPQPSTEGWSNVYDCLNELQKNETPGSIYHSLVRSDEAKYWAWILAALTPWTSIPEPENPRPKSQPFGAMVAKEGIKATSKLTSLITGAFKQYKEIIGFKNAINKKEPHIHERDAVGMSIRRWDSQGQHWRLQALFAMLVETMNSDVSSGFKQIFLEWQTFIDHLEEMELMDAPSIKGIIDGKELAAELGQKKMGPWMGPALKICMEWQLRNPGVTDPKGAVEEVRIRSEELKIPLSKK